ncbi:LVIVD repeat-containing protein [Salmonirosea aquatica]|uniref:LVIVD repeat-containing protein n=1 Tax=Salmonirosea aquatica TaxID=2654236 RepID=A0A7C9FY96_9BACT|nr:hypothetical protein [Cytophagaceae bacterium SJW1-29]
MKKNYFLLFGILAVMAGCEPVRDEVPNGPVFDNTAYRPVYATQAELTKIETQEPRPLRKPGKIYVKGDYLFVNELGEGIHVIDNSDPAKPEKIAFLSILANYDMAVKGNYLYADNGRDLVVFDISNPTAIKTVKRIGQAIPQYDFPPFQNIYFECVDSKKGFVVSWEKVSVSAPPACFR